MPQICIFVSEIMTNKQAILEKIKSANRELSKYGLKSIGLFGSYVRNEQTETSDIDLLIDFEAGKETYDNFLAACAFLEELFANQKVEVVTKNGLSPFIGPAILNEVQYAPLPLFLSRSILNK
jgi:predicted nucleotidyltransferase